MEISLPRHTHPESMKLPAVSVLEDVRGSRIVHHETVEGPKYKSLRANWGRSRMIVSLRRSSLRLSLTYIKLLHGTYITT